MTKLGTKPLGDVEEPMTARDDGSGNYDFGIVTGDRRIEQRILRGLFTRKGEVHHRPEWGANLRQYKSEPATAATRQSLSRDARRFIEDIPGVEQASVRVKDLDGGGRQLDIKCKSNGETLLVTTVTI